MFKFQEVGALVINNTVTFSIYLPGIVDPNFSVSVRYINKSDQFNKSVPSTAVQLSPCNIVDNAWGQIEKTTWRSNPIQLGNGTYFYRYEIQGPSKVNGNEVRSLYFGDPFAQETSSGVFSTFHIGKLPFVWNENAAFKIPWITDAIIYEMNVAEFNSDFDGIRDRIPYLKSLGINVLELLPVTGVAEPSQWGYTPIFYFAPEERFGGPEALKRLVEACHNEDIAVILDLVIPHSDTFFPFQVAYERFFDLWFDNQYFDQLSNSIKRSPNPMVSKHANYGYKNDFRMDSTREFFKAVCEFWIDEYHIDGFRFDHVNGLLDKAPSPNNENADWGSYRPTFESLQDITNHVYEYSKQHPRFQDPNGSSRVIQIAEDLNQGAYQLSGISKSAVNGCWEESLYYASTDMALWKCLNGNYLKELLVKDEKWNNFNGTKTVGQDTIPASPVLYHNSHDKSFLLYRIERKNEWEVNPFDFPSGIDKIQWYKLQPFAISLLTGVGTPMIWAGEEFAESYGLPDSGYGRVRGARQLHWDNFYTPYEFPDSMTVLPLVTLYRNLCELRKTHEALRGPRTNAVKEAEDFQRQVIVYRRWFNSQVFVIAVNFSDTDNLSVAIPFGHTGKWIDVLDKYYHQQNPYSVDVDSSGWKNIEVPSNFGRIFLLE